MPKYRRFEDLPVWQGAARLYNLALDFVEKPGAPVSAAFRNQLERAALSVSNNIAEGFERSSNQELKSFLAIAKGSAGEVRSMIAVILARPKLKAHEADLRRIRENAEDCSRQLMGWLGTLAAPEFEGKRQFRSEAVQARKVASAARDFKLKFLRELKPEHPLFGTDEAREARGERVE